MRKRNVIIGYALSLILIFLTGCGGSASSGLTKVRLQEVANGNGADKVMTAMIAGEADIGFMGPESTIYTFNEGNADYAVNFAQLTQRAGNFLVGRSDDAEFTWQDLKGKTVIGGRAGVNH